MSRAIFSDEEESEPQNGELSLHVAVDPGAREGSECCEPGRRADYLGVLDGMSARERTLEELVSKTRDAVVFIDQRGRICRFNLAAETIFGYSAGEVLGQGVQVLMPEPYRSAHDGYVKRYEQTGEPRAIGRIRAVTGRRKNGEVFPMELSVTELGMDDQIAYAAFIRDVSEQKALHERLMHNERLAAVGTAASMFAHEVANPLNNMYILAQILQRDLGKLGIPEKVRGRLGSFVSEVERLNGLLEEFRSYHQRDELECTPTDLGDLFDHVARVSLPRATSSGVKIEVEIQDGLPPVNGNADKLTQVFVNLVKNGVEAMPQGGTLTMEARSNGDRVTAVVQDTGVGIPSGVDVFELFRTTKAKGTGLGLAIVRKLVDAHRGTITHSGEPGVGTKFTVVLPVAM